VRLVKALIPLIPLCLLSFYSCKPGPGSSCRIGEARCLDGKREIICDPDQLRFVEVPCKGKKGCVTEHERTACDISGNASGDPCSALDRGVAFCLGGDAMLACHDEKFERVPCRGPRGCVMLGEQASCDQSIAEIGEACEAANRKACSVDKTQVLTCASFHMAAEFVCRGEGQCRSAGGKLACDQTVAKLGDGCDKRLSGDIACSLDRKALLVCKDEKFVWSEKCKRGTLCAVNGQSTGCEKP
jgi:hypothetical protein